MKKTIDVCVGTDRARNLGVRLSLMVVDEATDRVQFEHYHRVTIAPGDDPAAIRAAVEAQIADPNSGVPFAPWPAIPDAEWAEVLAHLKVAHTRGLGA